VTVDYRYDEFTNRVVTRCEGAVNLAEVTAHFRQLGRDGRLKPQCDVLLDLTFMTQLPNAEQFDHMITMLEDLIDLVPFGRCAVIETDGLAYELGRMFQGFTWPLFAGVRVFRNNADANVWLQQDA